jgi:ATP-binding cassette subfamily B protein
LEPADVPGALDARTFARGEVEFDDVSFRYDQGGDVLRGMSFAARAGELVALVGRSGSGKTTAVSLITRLYEVAAGRILIDGVDIRRYSLKSLPRHASVVLQEGLVFPGSVRDNLRYGQLDASDAQLEAAALDNITEASIFESLRQLQAGRTTFVIAHRLSTVRAADRILVVDQGRIVSQGQHDSLVATCPFVRVARAAADRSAGPTRGARSRLVSVPLPTMRSASRREGRHYETSRKIRGTPRLGRRRPSAAEPGTL